MIVAAAILKDGEIYWLPRPARHHHVIELMTSAGVSAHGGEQGFKTEAGDFVDRIAAARIAIDAGQIEALKWPPNLYSEDLW